MSGNEKKTVSEENIEAVETPKTQKAKKKIDKEMIKKMTSLALLTAIIVVLQLLAPVLLPILRVNISFALVPMTIGAILYGPTGGAILGAAFGIMTIVNGITNGDGFTALLLGSSPVLTVLLCLVKGTAAGFFAGAIYKLFRRKSVVAATFAASATAPIVNTAIFVSGSLTILTKPVLDAAAQIGITGNSVVYIVVIGLAGINFLAEFGVNMLFATAIKTIVDAVQKATSKK